MGLLYPRVGSGQLGQDWVKGGQDRAKSGQHINSSAVSTEAFASLIAIRGGTAIHCGVTDREKLADKDLSHNAMEG